MSYYQLASLLLTVYMAWDVLPVSYAVLHKQNLTIGWAYRIFMTLVLVNLAVAFLGAPWRP